MSKTTDDKARQYAAEFQKLPHRKQRQGLHNFALARAAGMIDRWGDATERPRPAASSTTKTKGESVGQSYARLAREADAKRRAGK